MLNANIPLNNRPTIRQPHRRIGLFLGLVTLGIWLGWQGTKITITGITVPKIIDASGITIRTTPTNTLWLATHTAGLSINANCPIDIPTLLSYKTTRWITIGDLSEEIQVHATGSIPEPLKNLHETFSCNLLETRKEYTLQKTTTASKTKKFLSLFTPNAWAWTNTEAKKIDLYDRGLNITTKQKDNKKIAWPEQNLTVALPLTSSNEGVLPETAQGITTLLEKNDGISFFSWESEQGTEYAYTFTNTLSDEEIITLFATIEHVDTTEEMLQREDGAKYTAIKQGQLTLIWITPESGQLHTKENDIRGYITKDNNQTYISTTPTTWLLNTPTWKLTRNRDSENISHKQHTLTEFGEEIYISKNMITLFQREM